MKKIHDRPSAKKKCYKKNSSDTFLFSSWAPNQLSDFRKALPVRKLAPFLWKFSFSHLFTNLNEFHNSSWGFFEKVVTYTIDFCCGWTKQRLPITLTYTICHILNHTHTYTKKERHMNLKLGKYNWIRHYAGGGRFSMFENFPFSNEKKKNLFFLQLFAFYVDNKHWNGNSVVHL